MAQLGEPQTRNELRYRRQALLANRAYAMADDGPMEVHLAAAPCTIRLHPAVLAAAIQRELDEVEAVMRANGDLI